ncbi:MAG: hypothetical protein K6E20_03285 [Acholeplasmatales bacterium]|nr:hypothetical protein [Acholeplasmatales bacterium]
MIFDLATLLIVGFILEIICVKFGTTVFFGTPFMCITFLITFIAVVRWNLWGLMIVPLLALATIIGGRWSELPYLAHVYDYKAYISIVLGLSTIGINSIFFIKFGTDKITVSFLKIVGLLLLDYVTFTIIQFISYRLMTSHSLLESGKIIYEYTNKNDVTKSYNLCNYGENGFVYNLFALIAGIVGTLVLRSQGVVCNAKQKSVEDRKNAELDRLDRENFTIEDAVNTDESDGETESDKDEDEDLHSI